MKDRPTCPLCHLSGLESYLNSYQINLDEAVYLCENSQCPYPLGSSECTNVTYSRSLGDIPLGQNSEHSSGLRDVTRDLQTRVASHMKKMGHRLQKDAVGIQTGSPQLKKGLKSFNNGISSTQTGCRKLSEQSLQGGISRSQNGSQNGSITVRTGSSCSTYNSYRTSQNGLHNSQNSTQSDQSDFQNNHNCLSLLDNHSTLPRNVSRSFNRLQSFTRIDTGVLGQRAWNSCAGSDGNSDKDSVLNSSLDSLDSHSSASSSHSADDIKRSSKPLSRFPAFDFGNSHRQKSIRTDTDSSFKLLNGNVKPSQHSVVGNISSEVVTEVPKSSDQTKNVYEGESSTNVQDLPTSPMSNNFQKSDIINPNCDVVNKCGTLVPGYPAVFPQWRNRDALCWLDVILCLTVHNQSLKSLVFSNLCDKSHIIHRLFDAHCQACLLMEKLTGSRPPSQAGRPSPELTLVCKTETEINKNDLEINRNNLHRKHGTSSSLESSVAQENGENENASIGQPGSSQELSREIKRGLDDIREEVWEILKLRLKCERGQHESPVFAFPLLLKELAAVDQLFRMTYRFEYKCSICGHEEQTDHSNTLPTFPSIVPDFMFSSPKHQKTCPKCGSTKDARSMSYKQLPRSFLMHFTEGLSPLTWLDLQKGFQFNGDCYTVTGLVQYIQNPDHFIAWLRNPLDNRWMKCDDLCQTACKYNDGDPAFSTQQIHIVMWEQHSLYPCSLSQESVCQKDKKAASWDMESATESVNCNPSNTLIYPQTQASDISPSLPSGKVNVKCKLQGLESRNIPNSTNVSANKPSLLTQIKKLENAFNSANTSPCSTLSGESGTLLLPNFITSTPVSTSLLRPVPKPISSVTSITLDKKSANIDEDKTTEITVHGNRSSNSCTEGLPVQQDDECHIAMPTEAVNTGSEKPCSMMFADQIEGTCTRLVGQKPLIQPSTVFCIPKKITETKFEPFSFDRIGQSKHSVALFVDGANLEHNYQSNSSPCDKNKSKVKDSSVEDTNFLDKNKQVRKVSAISMSPKQQTSPCVSQFGEEKRLKSLKVNLQDIFGKKNEIEGSKFESCKSSKITVDRSANSSRLSTQSKFRLPITKSSSRYSTVSKDAFFTLESDPTSKMSSSSGNPAADVWVSSASTNGNMTVLDSVKQYLLSRTNSKSEHKFEGLNLKSASRTNLSSLSELNLRVTSYSGAGACPTVTNSSLNSSSNCKLSFSNSSEKSGDAHVQEKMLNSLQQFPLRNPKKLSTSANQLSSSHTFAKTRRPYMKRTQETNKNVNQWIEDNAADCDHTSQKENSSYMTLRKRVPVHKQVIGGKKMKLVKQQADKSGGNLFEETLDALCNPQSKINDAVAIETKCETETVLQDLYEALNIPFNSMDSTLSDILIDVDDILDFVSVNDLLPEERGCSTPLSCPDISPHSKKHSD